MNGVFHSYSKDSDINNSCKRIERLKEGFLVLLDGKFETKTEHAKFVDDFQYHLDECAFSGNEKLKAIEELEQYIQELETVIDPTKFANDLQYRLDETITTSRDVARLKQ